MLLFSALSAALALSSSALAIPFPDSSNAGVFKSSVFEKLAKPPVGWEMDDSVEFDKNGSSVKLRIHLAQQNMRDFHDLAMKVLIPDTFSDPKIQSWEAYCLLAFLENASHVMEINK